MAGTGWLYRVVVQGGGTGWWYRVVVQTGGTGWWYRVVVQGGGTGWWYRVVVQGGWLDLSHIPIQTIASTTTTTAHGSLPESLTFCREYLVLQFFLD